VNGSGNDEIPEPPGSRDNCGNLMKVPHWALLWKTDRRTCRFCPGNIICQYNPEGVPGSALRRQPTDARMTP